MRKTSTPQIPTMPDIVSPKAAVKTAPAPPAATSAKRVPRSAATKAAITPAPIQAVAPTKPAAAGKPSPAKAAKSISVRVVAAPPVPVRVVAETPASYFTGAGGRAWRMSGKHAVAYVRDAALAGELLATEPRHLAKSAMAVYYDRKGKPFAWQLRFDTARWEEVVGRLA